MKTLRVALMLFLVSLSIAAMGATPETKAISTPDGPVMMTTTTTEPTPQKITVVSPKRRHSIDASASKAREFVISYLPSVSNPSLRDFDEAFRLWQKEARRRYTEQQVIELLGAYLGNRLVADFQMEWVTVTDQYGTDEAVRGKKFEVMSFPFSSVAKRIKKNQHDFMVGVYQVVGHSIASGDYKAR